MTISTGAVASKAVRSIRRAPDHQGVDLVRGGGGDGGRGGLVTGLAMFASAAMAGVKVADAAKFISFFKDVPCS